MHHRPNYIKSRAKATNTWPDDCVYHETEYRLWVLTSMSTFGYTFQRRGDRLILQFFRYFRFLESLNLIYFQTKHM